MKWILTFESYDYDPIFNKLDLFLSYTNRNMWLYDDENNPTFSIYVRKGKHSFRGDMYDFIDLASIDIIQERQGEGIFTNFLKKLLIKYPDKNFYVESILNPAVRHICKKFGFEDVDEHNMALIRTEPLYTLKKPILENTKNGYYRQVERPIDDPKTVQFTAREFNEVKRLGSLERYLNIHLTYRDKYNQSKLDLISMFDDRTSINIVKLEDDYFRVVISDHIKLKHSIFIADQLDGLIELLKDIDLILMSN